MVLTSNNKMGNEGKDTGAWLGELTDPYYDFIDKGYEVQLASPKGAEPPLDPRSLLTENITSSNRRFKDDKRAQQAFKNTLKLSEVDPQPFDALFFPGGHGPMWDLAGDEDNARLVLHFHRKGKPIGAICHGPAGLLKAAEKEPGLLKGRKVTAFSNLEEKGVGLYDSIPFKLEDRLKELGAEYHAATVPFTAKVVQDGLLITGQNPASASPAARALIEQLEISRVLHE